jgi:hypothetical protein
MARQKASRNPESLPKQCEWCGFLVEDCNCQYGKKAHPESLITSCGACGQDVIIKKKKVSLRKEFCEACYHNKEAHTFGNCAYCNCKGFIEKKKVSL